MRNRIYNAAIIGCGNIAGNYDTKKINKYSFTHAGSYAISKRVKLIAITDNNKNNLNKFKKKWKVSKAYSDYKKMLRDEKIDILSICSPTNTHFDILNHSINNKNLKAIFLEKPSTFKSAETLKIIKKLKNKNILVSVNYFRRWNNSFVNFKKNVILNNKVKIKKVQISYTKGIYVSASHQIDLMRFLFGEPRSYNVSRRYKKKNNDLGVDFNLKFPSNIDVCFTHIPDVDYVFFDIMIYFDNKIYNISQRGQNIITYSSVQDKYYNIFNKIKKSSSLNTEWKNCISKAINEIVYSLDNGIVFSSSNLYNAYNNTKICEGIYNLK